LKDLRMQLGKTQKEVAEEMGLLTTTYSNYEQGLREPSMEVLKILCEYYGVSANYLIGVDD
ncbi:MAG: helix-turn-helix domain-containing protein, partial [Clostridia bacterium]|nr:helix-turn-helix domain-containing protein [Clostridia bacterium]